MSKPDKTIAHLTYKILEYKSGESDMSANELANYIYGQCYVDITGSAVRPAPSPNQNQQQKEGE